MPNLIKKLTAFAQSPKGTAAIAKAREQAAKPENRARLEQMKARFVKRP